MSAGHELAFYPENRLEEVPRRLSRLLYLLEEDFGGEEIMALQARLQCLLGLDEVYSNPASPLVGTGEEAENEMLSMSNANYRGAPVKK